MNQAFCCKNKVRLKKLRSSNAINGIDYLEVDPSQHTLTIYFIHELPGQLNGIPANPPLSKENIFIEGGVRVKNIGVLSVSASGRMLVVTTDLAGDFSKYTFKVCQSDIDRDTPPDGFDTQSSSVDFYFKINCPNEFDCDTQIVCPPEKLIDPSINYLAKDYASFNTLILDRLSSLIPDWKERSAADLQVVLVELLAYLGDQLSYYQDAVATEAYLGTARRRISLKRHARLLDYSVHDGCNARVWIQLEVEKDGNADKLTLQKETLFLTNSILGNPAVDLQEARTLITEQGAVPFESMHPVTLHSEHNIVSFYTWGDDECHLPKGSTSATLLNSPAMFFVAGDVIVIEELYGPDTGLKADANPARRHVVRLKSVIPGNDKLTNKDILKVEWDQEDALPFSFCLTGSVLNEDDIIPANEKSIARGNVVLADHGRTFNEAKLIPAAAVDGQYYYPSLGALDISATVAYDHDSAVSSPALYATEQNPHAALAAVKLFEQFGTWLPQRDLLGSSRFAREFVVETEQDGKSFLRFGDDTTGGQKPTTGFNPTVSYRVGNGQTGNVGRNTIRTVQWRFGGISSVRNPLAAAGGQDPESMEQIRQFAPQAFRVQERAVTADDYVAKTQLHPEVQNAAAKFYWTGSWYTVFIIIDRKNGKPIDQPFKVEITRHLDQYRMAGYDLEIREPQFVPVEIMLKICVKEGYFQSHVKQSLLDEFSNQERSDGSRGFFHPDNFTFGQPVYLSALYQVAMRVQGVGSVEVKKLNRWRKNPANEIQNGLLVVSELQIVQVDSDPDFPENGKIDFIMFGGL